MKNWENVGQFILTQAFWIIIHLKYKIKNILLCDFFFPSNIWTNKPPNVFTQFKRVRKSSILIKNAVWLLNFPSNILLPFHENS